MKKSFYLTTTLPYVNAEPHIGFALEIVAADVIARYHRSLGENVIFNTGTDEHGQKIFEKAQEANEDTQKYVDRYAAAFSNLQTLLELSYSHFIRTTNPDHKAAAQIFWERCAANGDIYKKNYQSLYCVGCELEKQASELVAGKCPLHPNKELETREEENYFFRFSRYQQELLNLYEANPHFVQPDSKYKEIVAFVSGGLQDFSISRLKSKMSWGVPVPNDDEHVMYVWFDALVNYISTLGWPKDLETFTDYWPGIQLAGKDNLRQQAAMWQAMLLSAQLPTSAGIYINGFISVGGEKMSKSLGNVISPTDMVDRYGTQGTRFLLMHLGPFGQDMDVTIEKFDTAYTAFLSNGLGNVCSRIAKMCANSQKDFSHIATSVETTKEYHEFLRNCEIKPALDYVVNKIQQLDRFLAEQQPWKQAPEVQYETLFQAVTQLLTIAVELEPYLPATSKQVLQHFSQVQIDSLQPLFPRL